MKAFTALVKVLSIAGLSSLVDAKNIILSNDDGWAATNIRATYNALKEDGHQVLLVAPVSQRSGWSGKFDIPSSKTLETNGEFNYLIAGEPSWGHESDDMNIWYFNGTPASCVAFGLDYIIPRYFNTSNSSSFETVDLVVAGPNEGNNLSPGTFAISGTVGATQSAVFRDIPAIAFSGANTNNSFFKDSLNNDSSNPSNIYAKKVVELVDLLFETQIEGEPVLPLSVGMNVNLPPVGSISTTNCTNPKWVFTRLTGADSLGYNVGYNETTGELYMATQDFKALAKCASGVCDLPSESYILAETDCQSSVTVFDIDYDAKAELSLPIKCRLNSIL